MNKTRQRESKAKAEDIRGGVKRASQEGLRFANSRSEGYIRNVNQAGRPIPLAGGVQMSSWAVSPASAFPWPGGV